MTQDALPNWFQNDGLVNFKKILLPEFKGSSSRFLQIGAYSGDASVWLYENILRGTDSVLVDVDTWEGSDEVAHYQMNWGTVESVYDLKTAQAKRDRVLVKYKGTSDSFFKNNVESYNFIYIDGDHTSYGVIKDAIASYESLKVGGIMAFDDYEWTGAVNLEDRPKMAIDSFLSIYNKKISIISKDYQCWVRKVA